MARLLSYWLLRFSMLFLTLAPAFAQDADEKPAPVVHATPAMWHVKGPRGEAWLLGSFHALPKNVDWQTPAIRHAIAAASVFVFEIPTDGDFRRQWALYYGGNALLPESVSLPSYFDSQMRGEWRTAVMHTGIAAEPLTRLRPWFAARAFEDAMKGDDVHLYAEEGVDNKIAKIAQERGAQVRGLETAEVHLHALMRDANTGNEIAQLRDAMHKAAIMKMRPFAQMLTAWETGDLKTIAAISDGDDPAARKALLDDRNHAWVPKIEKMLTEKRVFLITVGAAHLAGPNGVPSLLRAAGYTVEGPDMPTKTASVN
jgi:uncharacterized protein YbaP (TraB family)